MKLFVFLCVATQLIVANCKILPTLPEPCHRSDPNIKSCFLKAIQKIIPTLSTGVPEYKILPMDPLELPYFLFNRTINQNFVLSAILKHARLTGFSQVTVEDLKIDVENLAGEITVKHPWFSLGTEFKVIGKIAAADIEMQAYFSGNFSDVTNHFEVSFRPVTRRGVKYYSVDNFKLDGTIGHADLDIIPKDPQDQFMVDFLLSTFNQNERTILDLFTPVYGDTMGDVLRSVLEGTLSQVPAERILVE